MIKYQGGQKIYGGGGGGGGQMPLPPPPERNPGQGVGREDKGKPPGKSLGGGGVKWYCMSGLHFKHATFGYQVCHKWGSQFTEAIMLKVSRSIV